MVVPDRRSSTDRRMQSLHEQEGQDDNDYEAMAISDGFRPADSHEHQLSNVRPLEQPMRRTTPPPPPPPRPLSTTKPKYDSFTLRHDGTMGPTAMDANTYGRRLSRSSTTLNEPASVGVGGSHQGPTGPPHAHQIYPQGFGSGESINTGMAAPILERGGSFAGPSRPIHPYGLYPQNIVPETDSSPHIVPIPIGFPGLNTYQPRSCSDRDTADIVGPDGHTEQLPPYSQYPTHGSESAARPVAARALQPLPPLPGAGGIGLATRNPEFESRETLSSPPSRHSTLSDLSSHQRSSTTLESSEKPELKKWQKIARKRLCAIVPIWAIALAATVFVLLIVVLTAIMAAHHNTEVVESPASKQSVTYTTMVTTTFDAFPFTALPTGLPQVPTGTYALPIGAPATAQSGCISNAAQNLAWSCAIPPSPLQMDIQNIQGGSSLMNKEVTLDYGNDSLNCFLYGAQPPVLSQPVVLNLVTDNQDPGRGPAWFFQVPYNKVVILDSTALSVPSTGWNSKREPDQSSNSPFQFMRKGAAQQGDEPWFCYWNGTILEYFIYTNLTSSSAIQATNSNSSSSTLTSRPSGSMPTQSVAAASATSSFAGGQSPNSSNSWANTLFLPGYPKVIKVEERRMPGIHQAIPPYCVQHRINSDNSASPIIVNGQPIQIFLNETEPNIVSILPGKREASNVVEKREQGGCCGCVWLST